MLTIIGSVDLPRTFAGGLKTFQEYLTAEEIFDRADVEDDTDIILSHFRQHLHDQHWREVLLLLVSKLKGKKAQKAIQTVLDAGSEYEQWLHRDLLFAGWCLTEDPSRLMAVAPEFVGEILDRLVGLEVEKSDLVGGKIRGEVEKILHCFGETTVERIVLEKLQAQGDRIDRFRLLGFQVALGQEIEATDILCSLLIDEDYNVRSSAASALGEIGNATPAVVSGLLSLLFDDDYSSVRFSAASSLVKLGNATPAVVSGLLSLLNGNIWGLAGLSSEVGKISNAIPALMSELISLLVDKDYNVRFSAALALGEIENATPAVISGLLSLLVDEHSYVRRSAASSLVKLGNTTPAVVRVLISLLVDQGFSEQLYVASVLGQIGNASPIVVNNLLVLLVNKNSDIRLIAASSLVQLGSVTPAVVNELLSLMIDKDSQVRSGAASALGRSGNATPAVVSGLFSLLGDKYWLVSSSATEALGKLAKISDAIYPEVLKWLEKNPNRSLTGSAIDCLWSIVVE